MRTKVKRWGSNVAVRIAASEMRAARLHLREDGEMREEAGRIVFKPIRLKMYDLDKLLKGITSKNQHESIDFDPPVGKEALSRSIR